MKATKFTIDRATWACGNRRHKPETRLLNPIDGSMCCLGFYAEACGVPRPNLELIGEYGDLGPQDVVDHLPAELASARLIECDDDDCAHDCDEEWERSTTDLETKLILANDDEGLSASQRESCIGELFASMGVTVEFTGEYPP